MSRVWIAFGGTAAVGFVALALFQSIIARALFGATVLLHEPVGRKRPDGVDTSGELPQVSREAQSSQDQIQTAGNESKHPDGGILTVGHGEDAAIQVQQPLAGAMSRPPLPAPQQAQVRTTALHLHALTLEYFFYE